MRETELLAHDRVVPLARFSPVELLAPAKNRIQGEAAIDHGADALYIGGPGFGARARAGNSLDDIHALCEYAHRYGARVMLALNTLIQEDEMEGAVRLAWDAYQAGVDALIMQDMGLLMQELPPIEWHASTQCDIRTLEKARFLESVGFDQLVLARESDLDTIAHIARHLKHARLEHFVHGALCVSYSGQCYISQSTHGRSANRGECAQLCRLPYDVFADDGTVLAQQSHLLSLKDNEQIEHLEALLNAGVRSLKIEGRLKDMLYVKNVTAAYREALDAILRRRPDLKRASAGQETFHFTPDLSKSFRREATDYFTLGKSFDDYRVVDPQTPKAQGVAVAVVERVTPGRVTVQPMPEVTLQNGDGFTYWDATHHVLRGLRINTVELDRAHAHLTLREKRIPFGLEPGVVLRRNVDMTWERLMSGTTAERHIPVSMTLYLEHPDGVSVMVTDGECVGTASVSLELNPAKDKVKNRDNVTQALSRLGGTEYALESLTIPEDLDVFLPVSIMNNLRRDALEALSEHRQAMHEEERHCSRYHEPGVAYPTLRLGAEGNVANSWAKAFYTEHGVKVWHSAFEITPRQDMALMTCQHCIRLTLNRCPKQLRHHPEWIKELGKEAFEPKRLTLVTPEGHVFWAHFHCQDKPCVMTLTHEGEAKPERGAF